MKLKRMIGKGESEALEFKEGATTIAGGLNASSLNVNGFSIADEYCTRWIEIKDLNIAQSETSKSSSSTINSLPLNSLTAAKSDDMAATSFLRLGGWITNTTIPKKSFGGNIDLLRKSESLETNTNPPAFDNEANLPFTIPFVAYSAENPLLSSKRFTDLEMFSSSRNFGESGITLSADELSSIFKSSRNMIPGNRGVVFQNILDGFSGSDQLNNITNQNSGASKSGLSMADFAVRYNIFTNFHSHIANNDNALFKSYDNRSLKTFYIEAKLK